MNRRSAEELIRRYCEIDPAPEGAIEGLVESDITKAEIDRLNEPGGSGAHDRIDAVIYGSRKAAGNEPGDAAEKAR